MEDAKLKSRHIIDLRQSAAAAPSQPQARKAAPKRLLSRKAATAPSAAAVAPPVAVPPVDTKPLVATPPARSSAPQAVYSDPPPQRRFWPAFWRFLVLVVILGLVITGGVYLYLKYYA
ncbi:MAG TPA: hypothetical protein VMR75_03490 [Candidatus Saccharimonadales bacterium]|nr:hypothetical protein [Candidatus Saccharimonadales bacterium]